MRARFVGDPNDNGSGPQQIACWGADFVKGEWREVDNDRFASHSHFEFEAEDKPVRGRRAKTEEAGE